MLDPYFEFLEVLQVYSQNDFQDIYICKHKEEDAYYLLNSIIDREVFRDVDLEELRRNISAIKEILETEEVIYILTEHLSKEALLDYVEKDKMTLTRQVNNITYIMETLLRLKSIPHSFVLSLFNHNNLLVNMQGDISSTGVLLFTPSILNASREDVLNTIADIIHIIFTGTELKDGKVLKGVPPDMERIITNCLSGNYFRIVDLVTDYKATNLYRLINPEMEEIKRVRRMRKSMTKTRITYNIKSKGIIILLILIPIIVFSSYKILKNKENSDTISSDSEIDKSQNIEEEYIADNEDDINDTINTVEDHNYIADFVDNKEVMGDFFNEDIIMSLNEKNIAIVQDTKFHRGEYSLKIFNESNEKASYLIGYIDFEDDNFSFAKNRTVDLSLWLNSDIDTDCSIRLKLGTKDKILTQVTKKASIIADTWTLHNVSVATTTGEYIKIYIDTKPKDTIWVDTMDIDILK